MAGDRFCTGTERHFPADQIIVSKTDPGGRITYANDTLLGISGYSEDELLGKPHNILRHPDMPSVVFRLLWERIRVGEEIFAYIVNRCKNGDHYWVYAHVTPNFGADGGIIGFHSCRRVARPAALAVLKPFYARLRQAESEGGRAAGMDRAQAMIDELVRGHGQESYDQFITTLGR